MRPLPLALIALAAAACDGSGAPKPAGSASASRPAPSTSGSATAPVETYGVPVGIPGDPSKIIAAVNGRHLAPYSGPKGTVKGKVRIEGDPPPDTNLKFLPRCKEGLATYSKLFRVGIDGALADVMVAVTGYEGFVPARGPAAKVPIRGCAANRRTVVMTYGQRIDVSNLDKLDSYVPFLDGALAVAGVVAIPGGEPVKLYPREPGRYMLRDQMPSGLLADVYVLKYATTDVTGLDGEFEIKDVPVGKVRVDAMLPVIGKGDGREIEVKEGENRVDFTLKFDAKKDLPGAAPSASASASASAAPSSSSSAPPLKPPR